jgi:putative NADPH-quinone reductase
MLLGAYVQGSEAGGHPTRALRLRTLQFDPILHGGFTAPTPLEPDLAYAQESIRWCGHLVIVTPNWWSSVPALLKGFFDLALLPGFAVDYLDRFPYIRKRLSGRSARVIYTQNAPQWLAVLAREDLFWRMMRRAVLGHCGFRPVRRTVLAPMKGATEAQRTRWLGAVRQLGRDSR